MCRIEGSPRNDNTAQIYDIQRELGYPFLQAGKQILSRGTPALQASLESTGVMAARGCRDGEEEVSPPIRPERRQVAEVQLQLPRPLPGHRVPGQPLLQGGGPRWRP